MSLKSVELQVAIPRSQDAGRLQEQLNQRQVIQHHQSAEEQKTHAELQRLKASHLESKNHSKISSDDPSSQEHSQQNDHHRNRQEKERGEEQAKHPFKGKHIDISL